MNKFKYYIDYLLLFLLLFLSGFPAAIPVQNNLRIILFVLSAAVFIYRRKKIDLHFLYIILVFVFITLWHFESFNIFEPLTALGIFLRISIAYFVVKTLGDKFPSLYVSIIYHLTIVSMIFWIPASLLPPVKDMLVSTRLFVPETFNDANFIIYHTNFGDYNESIFTRNSGPFWEPGAFGGYLVIALMFLLMQYNKVVNRNKWARTTFVIIVGIISTFSTTTFLAFFILSAFVFLYQRLSLNRIVIVVVAFSIYFAAFLSLDFLRDKILDQVDRSQGDVAYTIHRTRISSAIIDFEDWKENPLFGRGKFESSRFDNFATALNRNNGTTDFLVMFGIIGFLVYFRSYYLSFKKLLNFYSIRSGFLLLNPAIFMVLIILLLGFSENYFLLPFFWSLVFLKVSYK